MHWTGCLLFDRSVQYISTDYWLLIKAQTFICMKIFFLQMHLNAKWDNGCKQKENVNSVNGTVYMHIKNCSVPGVNSCFAQPYMRLARYWQDNSNQFQSFHISCIETLHSRYLDNRNNRHKQLFMLSNKYNSCMQSFDSFGPIPNNPGGTSFVGDRTVTCVTSNIYFIHRFSSFVLLVMHVILDFAITSLFSVKRFPFQMKSYHSINIYFISLLASNAYKW